MKCRYAVLCLVLLAVASVHAELRLPHLFGDHMVVQRDKPWRVWGWAEPGEKTTVAFGGQVRSGVADEGGRWRVEMEQVPASSEARELNVSAGSKSLTIRDVLVGDVWLCGGQSNMEWSMRATRDSDVEIPAANFPGIRFIRLPKVAHLEPQDNFPVENPESPTGNWRLAVSNQVENCTGVGYYFAKRIHRRLNVPVGLIDTSWGGTMAQHWVSKETLRPIPEMAPYFEKFEVALKQWEDGGREEGAKKRYEQDLKAWEEARAKAKAEGEKEPRKPNSKAYTNPALKGQPGGMLNGCIMPLANCAIKGVLFYQGENNSFTVGWKPFPKTYPAVVSDWRKIFGDAKLPFGLVQIAGWSNRRGMEYDMNHHCNIVREVQFNTWKATPNTGLIVTFDTNVSQGIHPIRKAPVGERAARWALAEVYSTLAHGSNRLLEWKGPVYRSMERKESKIVISFEEETCRGLVLDQDVEEGFYIAGEDRVFQHARARVDRGKNQLIVWNDEIQEPVAVRYGWSNLPAGGLMNRRELPAYPFRTDTWPMTPHQSTGSYVVE
ncbi:MAG: sialate O-acetylesterase [Kiritimatiellia bacterium]|jgi:sialate O-acetylesterase|nr:sialate O-acetylesterase [Kiritimatiellia bacterium]